jgi:hypothetical protein
MEKFFNKMHPPTVKGDNCNIEMSTNETDQSDLLGQLRNASNRNSIRPSDKPSEQLWGPYFSRNTSYSISDITLSNRIANSGKTLQGWKVIDKRRIYTTYRNGKLVQGEGAEGFKLAMGDAPKSKGKKRGPTEISKLEGSPEVHNPRKNSTVIISSSSSMRVASGSQNDSNHLNLQKAQKIVEEVDHENHDKNSDFDFCFT